jgi:hypothetical protein
MKKLDVNKKKFIVLFSLNESNRMMAGDAEIVR